MANELTAMPASFTAGTTVKLRLSFPDLLPGGGATLKLHLAGKSVLTGGVAATADGNDWLVEITDEATAAFPTGLYAWSALGTKDGMVTELATGSVVLTRNLATAVAGDAQSADEKELVLVKAEILKREESGLDSWSIEGEGVQKIPIEQLYARERQLRRRIAQSRNPLPFSSITRLHPQRSGTT